MLLSFRASYYNSVIVSHIAEDFYVHKKSFYLRVQESSQEVQNVILKYSSISDYYITFIFCAPTCFGYLLWLSTGSYNITKT